MYLCCSVTTTRAPLFHSAKLQPQLIPSFRVFFSLLDGHLGQSKCRERSLQEVLELCWDRCRLRRRLVQLSRHPHQLVLLLRPIRLQQTRESALYLQLGPVVSLTEIILILLQIPLSEVLRGDRSIRLAAMLQAQHQACH